jgi:hypothetical protein
VARIVAVAADLLLSSKVEAMLSAAGHDVALSSTLTEAPLDGADLLVVGLGIPVLGYYSHVNVDTKQAAEAAGVDLAVPRSRMARELPQLVDRLITR